MISANLYISFPKIECHVISIKYFLDCTHVDVLRSMFKSFKSLVFMVRLIYSWCSQFFCTQIFCVDDTLAGFFSLACSLGTSMLPSENRARDCTHVICRTWFRVAVYCHLNGVVDILDLCEYNLSNSQHYVSFGLQFASYPL